MSLASRWHFQRKWRVCSDDNLFSDEINRAITKARYPHVSLPVLKPSSYYSKWPFRLTSRENANEYNVVILSMYIMYLLLTELYFQGDCLRLKVTSSIAQVCTLHFDMKRNELLPSRKWWMLTSSVNAISKTFLRRSAFTMIWSIFWFD